MPVVAPLDGSLPQQVSDRGDAIERDKAASASGIDDAYSGRHGLEAPAIGISATSDVDLASPQPQLGANAAINESNS